MFRRLTIASMSAAFALALLCAPIPAAASTVAACATPEGYLRCGRAFPDPEAAMDTDPDAEGNIPVGGFIQFGTGEAGGSEIWDGLKFLQSRYDRWLQVESLEDLLADKDARSAGVWLGGMRDRLPLILARATDETVPAAGKERFIFAVSLHGIERAGAEGGTRALEDLATYAYCESLGSLEAARSDAACAQQTQVKRGEFSENAGGFPVHILPWDETSLTMGELLKTAEIYFAYVNPDGWHRGDVGSAGGFGHYQRYNGNGADPNRDWPTVGYTFPPYTPGSEPETRAFGRALRNISRSWAGGGDLHGQGDAPALTFTMLAAGQHDYAKDQRIRFAAQRAQADAAKRLTWSPLIVQYGEPRLDAGFGIAGISQMYPQQWGTVWDTIDYTTTGDFGGFIDDDVVGLNAIPLNNEMSYSHITNCGVGSCFLTPIEQLHVAGNKGLIYTHIDSVIRTAATDYRFPFTGRGAYVRYGATVSSAGAKGSSVQARNLPAQATIAGTLPCARTCTSDEFELADASAGVSNGGLTLEIGYLGSHTINDMQGRLRLERLVSDHGEPSGWEPVAENFNASQLYLNNGTSLTLNDPLPGRYRFVLTGQPGAYSFEIRFTTRSAYEDPGQLPFEATPFEFFDELNEYLPKANRFESLSASAIIDDPAALEDYDVLVLVDDALPGWDEAKPARSSLSRSKHDSYFGALRTWVRGGGRLVMLDGALRGLSDVVGRKVPAAMSKEYAGFIQFDDGSNDDSSDTYSDPLARDVNVPGAAEGSGHRHQTYEPVPLGFRISANIGDRNDVHSPVWRVDGPAFTKAKGRIAGTLHGGVTLGEVKLGEGVVRIAGALLPKPSVAFDHPFGVKSYALTYTGWQLMRNLFDVPSAPTPGPTVLGTRTTLPNTGVAPGWLFIAMFAAPAALIVRRLRHRSWV